MRSADTDWPKFRVSDVVERHFCGPSPDCEERPVFDEAEWGVLKTTAITWSGWNETAHKVLPRAYWGRTGIEVRAGDVLVTKAGPRHRVGVVTHVPSTRPQLVVSGKMIALRPRTDSVLPEILAGLLARRSPQKFIHDRTTGMAESQVNFANEVLLNTPLRIPPMVDQLAIQSVGAALDTAIRQTEAIIEKLKLVKQGLLHDLLTRGIDANGELRPPQSQAPHLYKDSPLGWIPRDWMAVALGRLASLKRGFDIIGTQFVPGIYPVISSSGVIGYHNVATSQGPNVVVGRKGSIGTVHHVKTDFWAHDTSLFVTNFFGNEVEFVYHLFNHLNLGQYGTKSGSPSLNRNDIHPRPVVRPPADEQIRIVSIIAAHDEKVHQSRLEKAKLVSLKAGLMDDLLTGRVRVTPLLHAAPASA